MTTIPCVHRLLGNDLLGRDLLGNDSLKTGWMGN